MSAGFSAYMPGLGIFTLIYRDLQRRPGRVIVGAEGEMVGVRKCENDENGKRKERKFVVEIGSR